MARQAATWANTSIIQQKFPHHFTETLQVLVILVPYAGKPVINNKKLGNTFEIKNLK